jgi:hypothetical protein
MSFVFDNVDGERHVIIDLTINNVEVMVVRDNHPIYTKRGRYDSFLNLCEGFVFSITGDDRNLRYKVAGYDVNKIDWAYPQDVLDDDEVVKRIRSGDRLCWSYVEDIWGHPQWDSEMIPKLRDAVMKSLVEELFNHLEGEDDE